MKIITLLAVAWIVTANAIAQTPAGEDWKVLVKEKRVNQPENETGDWKWTDQPLPPIESIVSRQPDDVPLYGCYSWGGEYKQFRKEIKEVGWTTYRIGGFPDEEALIMAMEDGIEIMKTLGIGKTLQEIKKAGKRNAFASDDEFIQAYVKTLDQFCARYGPGGTLFKDRPDLAKRAVRHVEIWNEPNFHYMIADRPDVAQVRVERDHLYAKVLRAAYSAIKSKYPEIEVVGFAAGGSSRDDIRFIGNVYAIDPKIGECYDILSTHPYTHAPPMADRVKPWGSYSIAGGWKGIRDILDRYGSGEKPIWYTEVGWPIRASDGGAFPDTKKLDQPVSAMQQAAFVTRLYVLASRLGVRRVHIMSTTDTDNFNSGFFDKNTREWRPSARATQEMIRLLPKPKIEAAISEVTGGLYAYRFKSDWKRAESPEVIVAWQEVKKGELLVPLPAGQKVAKVLNMFGGEVPFSIAADNAAQFVGGPFPSYVVLE